MTPVSIGKQLLTSGRSLHHLHLQGLTDTYPEIGGSKSLRNIVIYLCEYTASCTGCVQSWSKLLGSHYRLVTGRRVLLITNGMAKQHDGFVSKASLSCFYQSATCFDTIY